VERVFWLGATVRERVRLRETAFHRLYSEYVGPHDRHHWRGTSFSYWMLLGGGVGCGHSPEALYPQIYGEDIPLILLTRLHDRSRAAKLLQAIDLTRGFAANNAIYAALRGLKNVSSLREEADWWRQHRGLLKAAVSRHDPADGASPLGHHMDLGRPGIRW
jgi:hypothetical protein